MSCSRVSTVCGEGKTHVEALVDGLELLVMRDVLVDLERALEVVLDDARHPVAKVSCLHRGSGGDITHSLRDLTPPNADLSEVSQRCTCRAAHEPLPHASGDELEWPGLDLFARGRDADDDGLAPACGRRQRNVLRQTCSDLCGRPRARIA